MHFILETEENGKLINYRYGIKKSNISSKAPEPTKKEKEDDFDVFAEDDNTEKKKTEPKAQPKKKEKPAAKSMVSFFVKVYEEDQDFDSLAKRILDIKIDGLTWNVNYSLVEVAYGMKKLQMACVVEDEKISVEDDIFEKISNTWADEVQAIDVASFQKL